MAADDGASGAALATVSSRGRVASADTAAAACVHGPSVACLSTRFDFRRLRRRVVVVDSPDAPIAHRPGGVVRILRRPNVRRDAIVQGTTR